MYRTYAATYRRNSSRTLPAVQNIRRILAVSIIVILACLLAILISLRLTAYTANAGTPDPGTKYYRSITVENGDSLWSIAENEMTNGWTDVRDYITEVEQINGLSSETIHAGSRLIVPYYAE
ncbi:MAG: LysM peptidoglycan-binding domain-containing protein [Lachnospiraceae bacterium]|jgi:LysM repeat protein|nr:LysM peptidoglycan-binding domain-containing protein [Lachnospiraceae bacterium]MCI1726705.1 LysM peptidoglycan-binding domain-containing protein [Lachnospiraceae bacterium]